jgi:hypothetical protein
LAGHQLIGANYVTPTLVSVVTDLRVYTDMAITSITFNRDRQTGDGLPFTVELTRVDKVQFKRVAIAAVAVKSTISTRVTPTSQVGKVTPVEPARSTAARIFDAIVTR